MLTNVPYYLPDNNVETFPLTSLALKDPDGLLAIGANLSLKTLITAYRSGVFPWYDDTQPIMWWSPSVRAVIPTDGMRVSKNMAKLIRQNRYQIKADTVFSKVINACGVRESTWITDEMFDAYCDLHAAGVAHSIEVFDGENLVGGLYGVFVRNCFCGESMFSNESNTSKIALITLASFLLANGCKLIDCQMPTSHLCSMGAVERSRSDFIEDLMNMQDNRLLTNTKWEEMWQRY